MSDYAFKNCDDYADEDDPDRAFKALCVGVANATKYHLVVETHAESKVTEVTSGKLEKKVHTLTNLI